jgi:hypothetical protein
MLALFGRSFPANARSALGSREFGIVRYERLRVRCDRSCGALVCGGHRGYVDICQAQYAANRRRGQLLAGVRAILVNAIVETIVFDDSGLGV